MTCQEVWIDLMATALVGPRMQGPTVVLHEAQRVFPFLESRAPLTWIHARTPAWHDFTVHPSRLPCPRERLDAAKDCEAAGAMLRRAGLVVLAMPTSPQAAGVFVDLLRELPSDRPLMVYGEGVSAGWEQLDRVPRQVPLLPLAVADMRLMVSPAVISVLESLGLNATTGADAAAAQALVAGLPRGLGVHLDLATPSGRPRIRIRPNPLQFVATLSESLEHHVLVENRALFNHRGVASVLLPWDGGAVTRYLLRNVRARVDDCQIACGSESLRPTVIDYTDAGAIMTLRVPATAAGHDSLLHLSLPRPAVPEDGFCDIGAAEFTVDLS